MASTETGLKLFTLDFKLPFMSGVIFPTFHELGHL